MHNMGKTICSRIQKPNKKPQVAKGKGKGKGKSKLAYAPKPKTFHLLRNSTRQRMRLATTAKRGVVSVSRLVDNGFVQCFTDYGISVSKNNVLYFNDIPCDGIYEIDMLNLVPNVNSIYIVSNKRAKHNLDSTYLWHCRLAHIKACGRVVELEEIQDKDTLPFENTSEHLVEVESLKPQIDVAPIRRSERTPQARDHLCLNVDVEEYSLSYLNEPNNYKVALSDLKSSKWLDVMNV
ncbi:hypothetical protein Tco_0039880 [Tanacetum coccineum]